MGTAKRERQKAGRAQRLEEARIAQDKAKRRNNLLFIGGAIALIVVLFGLNYFRTKDNTSASGTTTTTAPTSTTNPASSLPTVAPGATLTGATPCPAADSSAARTTTFAQAPPLCIDAAKTYTAKVATSKGEFTMTLDAKAAPNTVNNFVVLARYHFYDGIPFHRVVTDFAIQTGDPLGSPPGTGGPGYKFDDELPKSVDDYKPGSVAMANSGPNTNGSQWFVWVGPTKLPSPAYSLFGAVSEGYDTTIQAIMKGGSSGSDGTPVDVTTITYVLIGENGVYPPAPTAPVPTIAPGAAPSAAVSTPSPSVPVASVTSSVPTAAPTSTPGAVPAPTVQPPASPVSTPAPTAPPDSAGGLDR